MNIDKQWSDLEERWAALEDLSFRLHVGIDIDQSNITEHAQSVSRLAESLATTCRQDPDAWSLLSNLIMAAKIKPIELELRHMMEKHLTFDDILLDSKPVTVYSRMQYLYQEDDPQKRHDLLSRINKGHPAIDKVMARYLNKQTELAKESGYTPLDDFLIGEGLHISQLRHLLVEMATAFGPAFEFYFAKNRNTVFGIKHGEPWEDFVTLYMNRWSVSVDSHLPSIDGAKLVTQLARSMGFEVDNIGMDIEDRPHKTPGASAWPIRIPNDVRISIKLAGNVDGLLMLYHEMGHALHFATIEAKLPFYIRNGFSSGVAETFSFWLDSLFADSLYLEELSWNEQQVTEMIRFKKLCIATFVTWLSVQALCVIDYWTDGPFTLEQLGERLSNYMMQFMGLLVPAEGEAISM